jgi:hypothetical protein
MCKTALVVAAFDIEARLGSSGCHMHIPMYVISQQGFGRENLLCMMYNCIHTT